MAKRKSSIKRLSRNNRSSIRSGFLDPNSEVLGEEEPFWWNNLTNNGNQSLVKNSIANQTSKYLDSDTQAELSNASNGWWNVLESTDSEVSNNLPRVQTDQLPDTVPRTTKTSLSDSDEEDSRLLLQKKKITIRGVSKRRRSNPFLKALFDSENSKSSKSIQDTTVAKPTNDLSIDNESSKESDFTQEHKSKKDNINVTTSSDHSHTTGNILKSRPQVFRKKYKGKGDNVFEDLLKSAENKSNETEATEMIHTNSSDKLIEENKVLEENVSNILEENYPNVLKEHTRQIHSMIKDVSKESITNQEISKNDGNRIYYERSDSSFEIRSDDIEEASREGSPVTENHRNQTTNFTHSSNKVNNSHINDIKIKSPENNNKNDKLLKNVSYIRVLNDGNKSQSSTHSKINNSKRLLDVTEQENTNEENMIQETNIENVISQSLSINKTKHRKSDLKIYSRNVEASFKDSNNTINNNTCNVTKNFENKRLSNDSKIKDSRKQINTINSHSKALLAKDIIQYKSNNNEQLEVEISTPSSKRMSIHDTANFNEENVSKDNNTIWPKESDIGTSMSQQKSKRTIDRESKSLIELKTDKLKKSFSKNNDKTQSEELNMSASMSQQKSKRTIGRESKSLIELQTDKLKKSFSKNTDKIQSEELNMSASMSQQKSKRTIGRESKSLIELQTDKLKKSFSKNTDKIQSEELNMSASMSQQKSKRTTGRESKSLIELQTDKLKKSFSKSTDKIQSEELNMGASTSKSQSENATNLYRQKRINEYFPSSFFKLNSEINEDVEIKKRLEQKKLKLDLDKIQVSTQLSKKEIREKIKELENEGMKKKPIKEIHKAYLVNGKPYKRPKLPRPKPWVTDRLYRYLWKVMEPKYKLLTRVESEKFVQRLSNSESIIIKSKKYEDYEDELDDLLNNMTRLGIIHTRNDFYDFCHEFLPYDFRVKVVPMIMPGNVKNIPFDPEKVYEPLLVE